MTGGAFIGETKVFKLQAGHIAHTPQSHGSPIVSVCQLLVIVLDAFAPPSFVIGQSRVSKRGLDSVGGALALERHGL